tara:strand:+ start:182 stop:982 length:801 start_codon:yes stop_codon:yes gene_type:complete
MNTTKEKLIELYKKRPIKIKLNEKYLNCDNEISKIHNEKIKIELFHYPFLNKCENYEIEKKNYKVIIYNIENICNNNIIHFLFDKYENNINFINIIPETDNYLKLLEKKYNLKLLLYRGIIKYNNEEYLFIQCKNSKNFLNNIWLTYYDIVINKKWFIFNVLDNVVNFFKNQLLIDKLYYNNKLSKQPIILYNYEINENYEFIRTYNNIYHKKYGELFKLINVKKEMDNTILVRYICFLDMQNNNYEIDSNCYYIFNLNNIYSNVL